MANKRNKDVYWAIGILGLVVVSLLIAITAGFVLLVWLKH